MIIRAQCQHCQSEFEDEGLERTVFCPSCGKETIIRSKGSNYAPISTDDDASGVIVVGYVCAVVIPFVGFFIGIYLMAKKQPGHGVATMALSILAGWIWRIIILAIFFS